MTNTKYKELAAEILNIALEPNLDYDTELYATMAHLDAFADEVLSENTEGIKFHTTQ